MKIETIRHENVLLDGTFKDQKGAVEVNGKIIMSQKNGGCTLDYCTCSEGHWITIMKPITEQGVVEGIRVQFDNESEMQTFLDKRELILPELKPIKEMVFNKKTVEEKPYEVILSKESSEKYFHNALCNSIGQMSGYGLEFDCDSMDYLKANESLRVKIENGNIPKEIFVLAGQKPSICREDVWMEVLRNGGKLTFKDIEGDDTYTRSITLQDVHNRVGKTPLKHLIAMINEEDDANTGDMILQTVFFEQIVFG